MKKKVEVQYSSNNSGGYWWLKDEDWDKLEKAGWKVNWYKNKENYGETFLGAKASSATKEFEEPNALEKAKAEWTEIIGQDPDEEGCSCCGQPHNFYDW